MYPLFHGMRSKKSEEEILRNGFCAYKSPVDESREIRLALKFFGKENLLSSHSSRGYRIRMLMNEMRLSKRRLNAYASTNIDATCNWWARANPEHVSLALNFAGIPDNVIDRYLKDRFGENCYTVELKLTSKESNPNFNLGMNCIPPNLIRTVKKCRSCDYSGQAIEDNLSMNEINVRSHLKRKQFILPSIDEMKQGFKF